MGIITEIITDIGIPLKRGKLLSYHDLYESGYKEVVFGTPEELQINTEIPSSIQKIIQNQNKNTRVVLWKNTSNWIITIQLGKEYEIIELQAQV